MFLPDRGGHACACADSLACLTCNFDGLKNIWKMHGNIWQFFKLAGQLTSLCKHH